MDFSVFSQPAFSGGGTYLDWVISGVKWTMLVSILAWVIAFSIGFTVTTPPASTPS